VTHTTEKPPAASRGHDALSALLETEQALRERLDAARTEAERIVNDAREQAHTAESALEATIARELAALDVAHEREVRAELDAIADRARSDAAKYEQVPEARVRELAAGVVAMVFGA
jgi:vacuolar-type H+-ATPase subunit H